MYRVGEDRQCATAANQMRQSTLNSYCRVEVANTAANTDNNGGSVMTTEKQHVKTSVLNDRGDKEVEYSSSLKIDSSFVADSLALDVFQSEKSEANALNHPHVAEQIQVKSEIVDMYCQIQTSDHEDEQKHASQRTVVPEQTSELVNVAAVTSSCVTHDSNLVSVLMTVFMIVMFRFLSHHLIKCNLVLSLQRRCCKVANSRRY